MQSLIRRVALALCAISLILAGYLLFRAIDSHGSLDAARRDGALFGPLLAALAFLIALIVLVFRPEQRTMPSLQRTSLSITMTLFIAITCVWYLVSSENRDDPAIGTLIADQAGIDTALAPYLEDGESPGDGQYLIPTGVYVQSLEFLSANNVQVTGYVWQTYASTVPASVTRGFVLPEAVEESYAAEEAYRHAVDGGEVIGWYFHAILRQQFDYRDYPFDRQDVWLRLWHPDLEGHAILVPDLNSYNDMLPAALPGLEDHFVYEGWNPEFTGFSYGDNGYNTTFGLDRETKPETWPELYYNIGLQRHSLSPLLDHALALTVTALLLFAAVRMMTADEARQVRLGNFAFEDVQFCAVLMFVVVLAHNGIRSSVSPQQIAYLEVFPFLLYVTILLVSLNSIMLAAPAPPRLIAYKDNIIAGLLFWPLLLGALLLLTLLMLSR